MENLIERFIAYLEGLKEVKDKIFAVDLVNLEFLNDDGSDIYKYNLKVLDYLIQVAKDYLNDKDTYFDQFKVLSDALLISDFNNRERFDIINFYIQKNISKIDREVRTFDFDIVINHPTFRKNKKEVIAFVTSPRFDAIINGNEKKMTLRELCMRNKLFKIFNELSEKKSFRTNRIYELKECFYKENLTSADIEHAFKIFEELGISPKITNPAKIRFLKKITSENKEAEKTILQPRHFTQPESTESSPVKEAKISKKDIIKEIEEYFDLETLENKCLIEGELLERIVYLVKTLDLGLNIRKIINENNRKIREEKHPNTLAKLISEENLSLYSNLISFLDKDENITYRDMFNYHFNQINELVREYETVEDESLIGDYQEQIALIFDEIRTYVDYLQTNLAH